MSDKDTILNPFPTVTKILDELSQSGYEVTLVGGLALTILGSQRVTKDADFLMMRDAREQRKLIDIFYKHGFEVVSKLNDKGEVVRTVDNSNVAFAKITMDKPVSFYFYNHNIEFRIDILLDFPFKANEIYARSIQMKIQGHTIRIASKEDLIAMKKIAIRDRKQSKDQQDLEFLQSL